jgi:hypothetical protein
MNDSKTTLPPTTNIALEKAIETMRSWRRQQEGPTFNGKIVMVKEGEMIIDKVSGLTYVTEKT